MFFAIFPGMMCEAKQNKQTTPWIILAILLFSATGFAAQPLESSAHDDEMVELQEHRSMSNMKVEAYSAAEAINNRYRSEYRDKYRALMSLMSPVEATKSLGGSWTMLAGTGVLTSMAVFNLLSAQDALEVPDGVEGGLFLTVINLDMVLVGAAYLTAGAVSTVRGRRAARAQWTLADTSTGPQSRKMKFAGFSPFGSVSSRSGGLKFNFIF